MNKIDILPCTISSFAHILPILETHAESFNYADKRQIMQLATRIIEENPRTPSVYIAQHEGIIVGFIGLNINSENPDIVALFGHAVKRGYQGQGIGTKLLRAGVDHSQSRGAGQITLQLKASMPQYVHQFYQKAGFKPSFSEGYTGASDENRTFILQIGHTPVAATPVGFYPV